MRFAIVTLAYGMYVQFSPKIGNIWYRNKSFVPKNLLILMMNPLHKKILWRVDMLDMNWPFWIALSTIPNLVR